MALCGRAQYAPAQPPVHCKALTGVISPVKISRNYFSHAGKVRLDDYRAQSLLSSLSWGSGSGELCSSTPLLCGPYTNPTLETWECSKRGRVVSPGEPPYEVCHAKVLKTLMEQWGMYKDECSRNMSSEPLPSGLLISTPAGLMAYRTPPSVCPAHGTCHGTPKIQYGRILSKFKAMYTVGYSLSLAALVLALGILVAFRKLHCMRNNIHMNLFASFILRALSILVKDALLDAPALNITQNFTPDNNVEQLRSNETAIGCRIAMVLMQYGIMANNYWLLVEGIYLHNLLVVTVFNERSYFNIYLCIGWGTPLIFLLPWVTVKYLYENEECWEQNINMGYWWIIRFPILLAVFINFFIFIRVIKILMSKLRAHQMRYTDYKFRLAKSTLTLIPLLGIHSILFALITDEQAPTGSLRLTKLFCDLLLNSFQGLLVAILYCFVNKEVQSELLKKWKRWKLGKDIEEEYRHTHSQTAQVKSTSVVLHHQLHHHDRPHAAPPLAPPDCDQEEDCHLMGQCQNGMGMEATKGKRSLLFPAQPHGGASSCCSLMETVSLEDRAQCYQAKLEGAESNF
ncbi:hypothetical protein JZ751_027512 [Albula glossodonta]|uniref:G-protein coupled receptors family 2 profile 2 domain-containing protein n=1 Tax=Albula glossodonta TaxID=121402 RepID=A0A8T2NG00_9TELE|nr:hypothetical protein JZ751_027512 [Albula glossodonta]